MDETGAFLYFIGGAGAEVRVGITVDSEPYADVRSAFLPERDLPDMIAADGIHLTMAGYERLFELLSAGVQSI